MSQYAAPNVVYRGYIVTTDRFTEIMKDIPEYKRLMELYGEDDHILCYTQWKLLALPENIRTRAPKIKPHWASGVPTSEEATHMMVLTSFIKAKTPELVKDKDMLLETENDRKSIVAITKFFQRMGIQSLKVEDFEYTYSVGRNPSLNVT